MNKKLTLLVLSTLIAMNNVQGTEVAKAIENSDKEVFIANENNKSEQVIYVTGGEGNLNDGNGSFENPYQNIRTALKNVEDGGTIKLIGTVLYTKYETHVDESPLPLYINKNITIEGNTEFDGLYLRSPIQLGANVTFKNMRLEMLPQTILGRSVNKKINSRLLGEEVAKGATIYAAGHELTLDKVNTKLGTNADQENKRPYISGGAYKNTGEMGKKAVINIINSTNETKISGIYAGDYWNDREMDVEINLNGKLVDTTIYTGGDLGILKGDVKVNLSSKANVTEFDKTNHIGNLDVTLKKDFFSALLNLNGINNLYMEENARVSLPKNSEFNVDNATLLNNAVIDFRNLTMNPLINGNFIGAIKSSDDIKGSAILLNNKQTLNIIGTVSGATRLNNCGVEYVAPLEEGHDYVKAYSKSTGEFTLIDRNTNYRIEEAEVGNTKSWSAIKEGQELTNIDWYENTSEVIENPVIAPGEFYNEYFYKIKYQDEEGKNMDVMDAIDHLKVEVIDEDGNVTGEFDDFDLFTTALGVRFHVELENDEYSEVILEIYKPEKVHGKLTLRVTDMKNNKIIEKPIYVVKDGDDIEGDVSLPQGAIVGSIISADISNLTEGCEELTYTWYADGNEVLKETNNEFKVTEEYLNQNITVKVSAKNKLNEIGSLSGTTVKSEEFAPVIKGVDDITISASDIDRFNETGKLDKVTATYENVDLKSEITVTGEARRPALGTSEVFELVYEVKNSLGISTKVVRQVTVSNHAPVISGLTDLIILEGEEVDLTKDVIAEDKEDGEITSITYPSEKSSELPVGLNTLEYSVQDKDGNITKMTRRVIVIGKTSNIAPTIIGADDKKITVGEVDEFIAKGYLDGVSATDDIDKTVEIKVTGKVEKPASGTNGVYKLTYILI